MNKNHNEILYLLQWILFKKKKKQKLASVSENVEKKGGPMYFGYNVN